MCDGEGPTLFFREFRRAAKPYTCKECRRPIAAGEQYEAHRGLWDGAWETYKWCMHCATAEVAMKPLIKNVCATYGDYWSALREDAHDLTLQRGQGMYLGRLIVSARRRWLFLRGPRAGTLRPHPAAPALARAA